MKVNGATHTHTHTPSYYPDLTTVIPAVVVPILASNL